MRKWIAPLVLSLVMAGGVAMPASAQYLDRPNPIRRDDLSSRANGIRDRAQRLMDDGRLSRGHYDQVMNKLDRVFTDVGERHRIGSDRFKSDQRYMDSIEATMNAWRDSDSVIIRHRDRERDFDDRD